MKKKEILETHFIQKSLFHFLPTQKKYSKLLIIENDNDFLTLSNGDIFICLLLKINIDILEKVNEKLDYIFNREKHIISFNKAEIETKNILTLNIKDIINHSEIHGVVKNNIFNLKLLKEFS